MGALSKMSVLPRLCIIHVKKILTFLEILKSSRLEYMAGYNRAMTCSFCEKYAYTSIINNKGIKYYLCENHVKKIRIAE